MQKFRKFADPATGINPFLPNPPESYSRLLYLLLPIAIIRLAIFTALLAVMLLTNKLLTSLQSFAVLNKLRRFLTCCNGVVLGRILLFVAGFWTISKGASPFTHEPKLKTKSGTAVFSNFQSPFDIVFLIYRLSPRFLRQIVFANDPSKYLYVQMSQRQIFTAVFNRNAFLPIVINSPEQLSGVKGNKLTLEKHIEDSRQNIMGPAALFFENVPTNGQGVLHPNYKSLFISINRPRFLFLLSYQSRGFPVQNTVDNGVLHLLRCMCNLRNMVYLENDTFLNDSSEFYLRMQFKKLEELFDRRLLRLSFKDYLGFLEMYRSSDRREKPHDA